MAKPSERAINWIKYTAIPWFTSLGLTKGTATFEIVGRKSGEPRKVSLTTVRSDGRRYVVALSGKSLWVKNLRAANGYAVMISGRRTPVQLVEISVEDRAPVLLGYVGQRAFSHSGAASAKIFFGLEPNPTLEEMEAIAGNYLVFRIEPRGSGELER
jgi:deazaflavin-dependent oxidoreductase (nitroreductase family)